MKSLSEEKSLTSAATVGHQVLSLAGDALCLAATALRLTLMPAGTETAERGARRASLPLREVPLSEVGCHDYPHDCWIVVHDLVYDVTSFLEEHPGGADLILEHAGRDASMAFRSVNHGPAAFKALERFLIGRLPASERIFGPTP